MPLTKLDEGEQRRRRRGIMVPLAFVCAVLLALPALTSPLFHDDVIHRAMLLDGAPGLRWSAFELYDFIGGPERPASGFREHGLVPWFTPDDLELRFFRPLSSSVLAADAYLFGERTWLSRLHSLAWFLATVALVSALYRRFLPGPSAGLATLMYAIAGAHLMPVSWIAARHALISAALALLAFWVYVRGREDGWKPARWLAPVVVMVGLLAGEMAIGALALIGAWELLGRRDTVRVRVTALAPFLVVAAGYAGFYVAMGYGARGSSLYLGGDAASLAAIPHRLLILIGELVAATPSDAFGTAPVTAQIGAALWGAAAAAAAWVVIRMVRTHVDSREKSALPWMAAAAVAAALPGTLAPLGGRVLTIALFPALGIMAVVLVRGIDAVRRGARRKSGRVFVMVAVAGFALGHLVTGPVARAGLGMWLAQLAREQHQRAAALQPCTGVMVIVVAADPMVATYIPATLTFRNRAPDHLHVLSLAPYDHRIENVGETGFDLVIRDEARSMSPWEGLYRNRPVATGTRVTLPSLDAAVIETRSGMPTRVRFDFGEPIDSERFCFFQWRNGDIGALSPPVPGDVIDVPHEPGPMGL